MRIKHIVHEDGYENSGDSVNSPLRDRKRDRITVNSPKSNASVYGLKKQQQDKLEQKTAKRAAREQQVHQERIQNEALITSFRQDVMEEESPDINSDVTLHQSNDFISAREMLDIEFENLINLPAQAPRAPEPGIVIDNVRRLPKAVNVPVVDPLHFYTYPTRMIDCPNHLSPSHKEIFRLLSTEQCVFLSEIARGRRFWTNWPSHKETFLQPLLDPQRQIHFSLSPKDRVYTGTWVSAVVRDANNVVYPMHIITKNTLGAVKNMIGYPERISKLFATVSNTWWPEGLGKECLIIHVDNLQQKNSLISDYEKLIRTLDDTAENTLPNFRVFCKDVLSPVYSPASCRQQSILHYIQINKVPNLLPLLNRQQALLRLEKSQLKTMQNQLSQQDFERVCNIYFSPNELSHELALTHFTLTEMIRFSTLLTESRERMITFKGDIYKSCKGDGIHAPQITALVQSLTQSIYNRTTIINKINDLKCSYLKYSKCLAQLLNVNLGQIIDAQFEDAIYTKIKDIMQQQGLGERFREQFTSGRQLIAWMFGRNIVVPHKSLLVAGHHYMESVMMDIRAQMPNQQAQPVN